MELEEKEVASLQEENGDGESARIERGIVTSFSIVLVGSNDVGEGEVRSHVCILDEAVGIEKELQLLTNENKEENFDGGFEAVR